MHLVSRYTKSLRYAPPIEYSVRSTSFCFRFSDRPRRDLETATTTTTITTTSSGETNVSRVSFDHGTRKVDTQR